MARTIFKTVLLDYKIIPKTAVSAGARGRAESRYPTKYDKHEYNQNTSRRRQHIDIYQLNRTVTHYRVRLMV